MHNADYWQVVSGRAGCGVRGAGAGWVMPANGAGSGADGSGRRVSTSISRRRRRRPACGSDVQRAAGGTRVAAASHEYTKADPTTRGAGRRRTGAVTSVRPSTHGTRGVWGARAGWS